MKRLKLLRLASFSGYGIDVTQNSPVVEVSDELAARLLATGYFEDLTPEAEGPPSGEMEESVPEGPPGMPEAPKRKGGRKK